MDECTCLRGEGEKKKEGKREKGVQSHVSMTNFHSSADGPIWQWKTSI